VQMLSMVVTLKLLFPQHIVHWQPVMSATADNNFIIRRIIDSKIRHDCDGGAAPWPMGRILLGSAVLTRLQRTVVTRDGNRTELELDS